MAEVGFYHLTRSSAEQALPQLLGRTLAAGERALVLCGSAERVAALDNALWLCAEPDWLPHGTKAMGHPELQPIWITDHTENPNGAKFLFLVDGAGMPDMTAFGRIFDLFDGNSEDQVVAARTRYTAARTAGHALTYWQQTARGWEKKA
jgi:DNA polymerase-3 subunit chi